MNPSILSIGNATKDIYLEISSEIKTYKDESNISHYDLTFDDSTLEYSKNYNIFGGVILSEQIFSSAHLKSFSNINPRGLANFDFQNEKYPFLQRYVISHDGKSSILSNKPKKLEWVAPIYVPQVVYLAENNLSKSYISAFKNYLKNHPEVRLIFSPNDFKNAETREFLSKADLIFIDWSQPVLGDLIDFSNFETAINSFLDLGVQNVVIFNGEEIIAGNKNQIAKIESKFRKNSFYQNQIFRASFVSQTLSDKNPVESLRIAVAMARNSDFNDLLKPIYAEQILARRSAEFSVENLKKVISLEEKMRKVAKDLVQKPKGIFAADESGGSIKKRFEIIGIADTEENRRRYREMFFSTPDIENYLSGVILFEETVEQTDSNGTNFVELLASKGILSGVKLDEGLQPLAGFDGETISKGLDSLEEKLEKYSKKGISFAKWRSAFEISRERDLPSLAAIAANVQVLARYAKMCQKFGIVPIVEPEVVFDGNYSIKDCRIATGRILMDLFDELKLFEVDLSATILKVNMILAGKKFEIQSSAKEVGAETAALLEKVVPKELAGVVFLSGGQTSSQATENLQAITNSGNFEFGVTYSFARAIQEPALKKWAGKSENLKQAQAAFIDEISKNSHALIKK